MISKNFDVAVIGGGIVGSMTARELSKYKLDIVVLEKRVKVANEQSKGSLELHPIYGPDNSKKKEFILKSFPMFKPLSEELGFELRRVGGTIIALNEEEEKSVDRYIEFCEANGVQAKKLDKEQLKEIEPNITDEAIAASYAPEAYVLDGFRVSQAVKENAMKNEVDYYFQTEVKDIKETSGDREYVLRTSREDIEADYIVNATGASVGEIARMMGDNDITIKNRRVEHYILDRNTEGLVNTNCKGANPDPEGFWRSNGYMIRTIHGGTSLVGSPPGLDEKDKYVEKDSDDAVSTTQEGYKWALKLSQRLIPKVNPGDIITQYAGSISYPFLEGRSLNPDIIVKLSEELSGVVHAVTLNPGLECSPQIAKTTINLLESEGLSLEENEEFDPYRQSMPHRKSFHPEYPEVEFEPHVDYEKVEDLANQDPDYGRVVCRCEGVTEGEVVEAIERGARTVDGVKQYTRAGMGRCQGGYCLPRIVRILARELDIPITEVTKKGEDSEIVKFRTKELLRSD